MTTPNSIRSIILMAVIAVGACTTVGPDYVPPEDNVSGEFREFGPGLAKGPADLAEWWNRFDDPTLTDLVERAWSRNLDVRAAVEAVNEARALRGVAESDFWPTVDVSATYRRAGDSRSTVFGQFFAFRGYDSFTTHFDAAWELDLFGRVARHVEAADAGIDAAVESARDALVSMVAECVLRYVELRAAQQRITIAETNVRLQEETLRLATARFDAGLVSERDVAQATANLSTTRARVPRLQIFERAAENRLAILLGLQPGALADELRAVAPIPRPSTAIAAGLPADLIRRRPDVRRAERQIARENALVGATLAELYPRIVLNGRLGVEAENFGDQFDGRSKVFGIGPAISWNLFDGARIRRRAEAQESRREQALLRFEAVVLRAVEEAENAMTAFVRGQFLRQLLVESRDAVQRAAEIARVQYEQGLADFQVVVDSERERAEIEDQIAAVDGEIAASIVALYKALGGGFEGLPLPLADEP